MNRTRKIGVLLAAWLVLIPLAVIVPDTPAQALAPEEDTWLLQNEAPEVEFGQRLSRGKSAHAALVSYPGGPTLGNLDKPDFRIWPHEDLNQLINLDSFLRITEGYNRKSWCICGWFVNIRFVAIPVGSRFEFRETDTGVSSREDCIGRGAPWFFGLTDASSFPFCGKEWEHSSDVTGEVEARARVLHWLFINGFGPFPVKSRASDPKMLDVGEVQNIGQTISLPVVDIPSGGGSSGGGWCSKWGIEIVCWVGGQAKDAALAALYYAMPFLEEVADFFEGCSDAVLDAAGGLVDILRELGDAITDPRAFVNEKLQEFRDLVAAIEEDPQAFVEEVLGSVLQLDTLDEEGFSTWLGSMICTLAIDYFTGKLGASVLAKARRWLRDRKNNPDPDRPPDPDCILSSFPGKTLVLMADGSLERIDAIEPGDWVISHNVDTSVWEPRLVVNQWSHLDRGPPATVTLADRSTVTATADHSFWVHSTQTWTELQWVQADDELLSPDGVVAVDSVAVGEPQDWIVWELTVEGNHNFTVMAGDTPLLVHNYNCQPNPTQLRDRTQQTSDRLRADGLDVTPEEVADAWRRYLENNPDADFDTWQRQYETLRRNNFLGNAHEMDILNRYGIDTKNGRTYPDVNGRGDFKPDAVISTDPPHFVEIKDYKDTVLYPGSNAGKQLEWLTRDAIDNPDRPGTFDLHITDESKISDGMRDLIREAEAAGVTVRINPTPP